jgi:hypothetical protein
MRDGEKNENNKIKKYKLYYLKIYFKTYKKMLDKLYKRTINNGQ